MNKSAILLYYNGSKSVSFEIRWYCVVGLHYYHSTWGLGEFFGSNIGNGGKNPMALRKWFTT
tara:strand:+ start:170 stop:355 length:186 start_codon:yes stop_codon:yes gene_type:complete